MTQTRRRKLGALSSLTPESLWRDGMRSGVGAMQMQRGREQRGREQRDQSRRRLARLADGRHDPGRPCRCCSGRVCGWQRGPLGRIGASVGVGARGGGGAGGSTGCAMALSPKAETVARATVEARQRDGAVGPTPIQETRAETAPAEPPPAAVSRALRRRKLHPLRAIARDAAIASGALAHAVDTKPVAGAAVGTLDAPRAVLATIAGRTGARRARTQAVPATIGRT